MKFSPNRLILTAAAMACATQVASAAFTFTNGDLILGFQASSGTGASQNVFFNLGSPLAYRDGTHPGGYIGNIGDTLTTIYNSGSGESAVHWYDRSDLHFGIIGNLNTGASTGIGATKPVDGDPSRTFYLSLAAATPGTGNLYAANTFNSNGLGTAGTTFGGMEMMLPGLAAEADGSAILSMTDQPTEWNNGWTVRNPVPGAAFGIFTGGIQQNFGKLGDATYVDLQRVVATNSGTDVVPGVIGGGTYVTTFAIHRNGDIYAIPEPSTALLGGLGALALLRRRRA